MPVDPAHTRIIAPHLRAPHPHPQYALAADLTALSEAVPTVANLAELDARLDIAEGTLADVPADTDAAIAAARVSVVYNDIPTVSALRVLHFRGQGVTIVDAGLGQASITINLGVLTPRQGGILDYDNGTLVWDIENELQVVDGP